MKLIRSGADFRALTRALESRLRQEVGPKAVRDGASLIAAEVRKRAPQATGELRADVVEHPVQVIRDKLSVEVEVGANLDSPHVASVEYGNAHMQPIPFIRPAFAVTRDKVARLITDRVRDAFD